MSYVCQGSPPPEYRRMLEVGRSPKLYAPSGDEKKRGKWAVVFELKDRDGAPDVNSRPHIIPTIGRNHEIGESCWCTPQRVARRDGVDAILHSVSR